MSVDEATVLSVIVISVTSDISELSMREGMSAYGSSSPRKNAGAEAARRMRVVALVIERANGRSAAGAEAVLVIRTGKMEGMLARRRACAPWKVRYQV